MAHLRTAIVAHQEIEAVPAAQRVVADGDAHPGNGDLPLVAAQDVVARSAVDQIISEGQIKISRIDE